MRLIAYRTGAQNDAVIVRPASARRHWMGATLDRSAFRCLPLTIANQHGWELLCPRSFEALWVGGSHQNTIQIVPLDDERGPLPQSHFGSGVLTFHPGWLFRTEPSFDLFVTGPVNHPKDGIYPLSAIVETTWLPYTFTMNWAFTRVGVPIQFEAGEPFCQVFPVPHAGLDAVVPECDVISNEPALATAYREWTESRDAFNADLQRPGSAAQAQKWQRFDTQGTCPAHRVIASEHQTRPVVRPFANMELLSRAGPADADPEQTPKAGHVPGPVKE